MIKNKIFGQMEDRPFLPFGSGNSSINFANISTVYL
jgi:hypothetical protein